MGTPGDSGGGWFIDVNGEMQLAAVTSFYLGDFSYVGATGALRVSLYNDWIDSYVPEPTSLLLLVAGVACSLIRRHGRA
jgi:hypothetical protein